MTTAADPSNYPAARKRSAGAAVEEAASGFPAPRSRVFPFYMLYAGTCRRTFSTPFLRGPAIIKGIELYGTSGATPLTFTVEIGTAPTPVTENNVAIGTPRPYNVLTELLDPFGGGLATVGDGFPMMTAPTYTAHYERPLDLIVEAGQFCVVVAMVNPSANAAEISGKLRVLEGVNPEALSFFL